MKTTINFSKEDIEQAFIMHLFATKGWRLEQGDIKISFVNYGIYTEVEEVEIFIKD